MDPSKYKKYNVSYSKAQINDVRAAVAYKQRQVVSNRPLVRAVKKDTSITLDNHKVPDIIPVAADKVFGLMQDVQLYAELHKNTQKPILQEHSDLSLKPKKLEFKKKIQAFQYWREIRFFLSGAAIALGMASFAYLGFFRQPISRAEQDLKASVQIHEDGTETHKNETGEEVNISSGVNINNIDPNPPAPIEPDMPAKLLIPKIKINAKVRSLGLARDGTLAVPNYFNQIGWYNKSSRPGSPGTVVLDGHYDISYDGTVFKNIDKVSAGDEIQIIRGDGEIFTYGIESKELYDKNSVPMELLISGDGKERLHIITCFGKWLPREQTYDKRMMIFAVRK